MGMAIFRENYKAKGWLKAVGSFMNQAGKYLNNIRGTGDILVTQNADGGIDIHYDGPGGRSPADKKTQKRKKWSLRYKRSINCRRPRGFSQKQYCKWGRKSNK